jgi:hypothetical protein
MKDTNTMVNFLVVGAQKGGTSALDSYLRIHMEIQMPKNKEMHFFDNDKNFKMGSFVTKINYKRYHKNFDGSPAKVKGECTPIYMYWREAIKRIYTYNPHMKIIAILRNPTYRAFSHWNMERDKNNDSLSFSQAIRNEAVRCKETLPLQNRVYSYIDRGYYSEQIRNIWRFFPKEQTLILKHEDLKNDPNVTLNKISALLGVSAFDKQENISVHSREYILNLEEEDEKFLNDLYFNDIKQLEQMLDWDCSDWLGICPNRVAGGR